jgi:hypothetical protein
MKIELGFVGKGGVFTQVLNGSDLEFDTLLRPNAKNPGGQFNIMQVVQTDIGQGLAVAAATGLASAALSHSFKRIDLRPDRAIWLDGLVLPGAQAFLYHGINIPDGAVAKIPVAGRSPGGYRMAMRFIPITRPIAVPLNGFPKAPE